MKLAVCFSGHLRSYQRTFDNWNRYILQTYAPDVFIHTWSHLGTVWNPTNAATKHSDNFADLIDSADVASKFQPVAMVIEDYQRARVDWQSITQRLLAYQTANPATKWCKVEAMVSCSRKVYLADCLSRGRAYDIVIRARTDNNPTCDIVAQCWRYLDAQTYCNVGGHLNDGDPKTFTAVVPELCVALPKITAHYCNHYIGLDKLLAYAQDTNNPLAVLNHHESQYRHMALAGLKPEYPIPQASYEIVR